MHPIPGPLLNGEVRGTTATPRWAERGVLGHILACVSRQPREAVTLANAEMFESLKSDDFIEGVAHFQERRAPRFTGR